MLNQSKKTDIKKGVNKFNRLAWIASQEGREIVSFPLADFYGGSQTAHQHALDWVASEYSKPRKGRGPHNIDQFEELRKCWVSSTVGPCLSGFRFVKKNKKSVTVASINGGKSIRIDRVHSVHFEPCASCSGGANYPHGYMD